jgi:hypothetical protein
VGVQVGQIEIVLLEGGMHHVVVATGRPPPHHAPGVGELRLPGVGGLVEEAARSGILGGLGHDQAQVHVEALEDRLVRPGQERPLALHPHRTGEAQMRLQPLVGDEVDAAGRGAAQIHRRAVRGFVIQDGEDAIPMREGRHGLTSNGEGAMREWTILKSRRRVNVWAAGRSSADPA